MFKLLASSLFLVFFTKQSIATTCGQFTWDYSGTEYWPVSHKDANGECLGYRQSPVNFNTSHLHDVYFWNRLYLTGYDKEISGTWSNNGHTLVFNPTKAGQTMPTLQFPFSTDTFEFEQFHFHWGSRDDLGSEHTEDGIAYPMELHLVHWNKKYMNFADAVDKLDGLLVLGMFFQISHTNDDSISDVTTAATACTNNGATHTGMVNLNDFLENVGPNYYHYKGSLTTPPCYESVEWLVLENVIPITEASMAIMRTMKYCDMSPMVDNFRPPQPWNNRFIRRVYN